MTPPKIRALVVDDDSSWRQILSEILSDSDLEVDVAGSVDEAVQALKDQPHRVAVVDLSLTPNDHNNYDGLRVLDAVRRLDPNCQTILLTGFATVELAVTALTDYGAFTFLRKESFHRSQFRDTVSRILAIAPQSSIAASRIEKPQPTLQKEFTDRVLVVEDDAGWRNILEELLADVGFHVRVCASFGDALGYLRREKFSLAVIDLSLKGSTSYSMDASNSELDGSQLLSNNYLEGIPTIIVSGVSNPEEIERIYAEHSISAFIEKRAFDRETFRRIVAEVRVSHPTFSKLSALTEREREVLNLLARGLTNKEIAEKLFITTNTVKRHLKAVFEKLEVHTRSAATAIAKGGFESYTSSITN
ncbi:Transcriptional regulatory protein DesR [Anaerolineales bacterium]|nr:Transcriptional regulatory protein DesR [Anaerolineales bacterium]